MKLASLGPHTVVPAPDNQDGTDALESKIELKPMESAAQFNYQDGEGEEFSKDPQERIGQLVDLVGRLKDSKKKRDQKELARKIWSYNKIKDPENIHRLPNFERKA